ncbi:MAG: 2-C-methyl-D-erythritol 2,4-cyclodiphosphate synthase, partial [Synergistaceae bacterium]|nr:2-C-methyl-D-erythritol 2,4-cyclodiphosphate synthase [Synergistaceae bacterium]
RTGLGYDVHRLVPERKLILGGVLIEDSPLGLLGHSDADLLSHAVADAILGGAGLPDIGNLFPASDDKFKNADSLELLREAYRLVKLNNFKVVWIDAVIQAQVPRLNKYLSLMRENFRKIFDDEDIVNIKAKSAETLDDAGAGLSMTCWAAATLEQV